MEIKKAQMLQLIHPTSQIQVITHTHHTLHQTAYFLTSLFPCLCLVLGACTFKTVIPVINCSLHTLGAMLWKHSSGLFHSPKLAPSPFSQRMPGHSGTGPCCCSDRLLKPAQNQKPVRPTGTQIPCDSQFDMQSPDQVLHPSMARCLRLPNLLNLLSAATRSCQFNLSQKY